MTDTFYPDISKYQSVVSSSYDYPILCFRADSGYGTDAHAEANFNAARRNPKVKLCVAYVVYIKGANSAIMSRLHTLFGKACPAGLSFMIDMESGSGFAGPGNHSTEANELADLLAIYAGSRARVVGYANGSDWSGCWPTHPTWLKRITARYGTTDPKTYGWQYSDGSGKWPVPHGYPAPKGVDMNVIHKPIAEILTDFGAPTPEEDDMSAADVAAINAHIDATVKAQVAAAVKALGDHIDAQASKLAHGVPGGFENSLDAIAKKVEVPQ